MTATRMALIPPARQSLDVASGLVDGEFVVMKAAPRRTPGDATELSNTSSASSPHIETRLFRGVG